MLMRLPIVEYPKIVRASLNHFGPVFQTAAQRRHFCQYVTGLIAGDKGTVQAISNLFLNKPDQSVLNKCMTQEYGQVEAKTRAAISGPITAAVTDDGQLAWVSAPITRVEGEGTQPLPLRAFAVYMQDGGDWKLIALHESLAVGEPGSGATFKKVIPPKPAEPKPAELIADKPKADAKPAKAAKAAKPAKAAKAAKAAKVEPKAKPKAKEPPKKKPQPEVKARPEKPAKTAEAEVEVAPAPRKKPKTRSKAKAKDDDEDGDRPKKRTFARAMAGEDSGGGEDTREAPKKAKKAKAAANAAEDPPKKKKKATPAAAEEAPRPKKKSPPPDEDADEIEIID
jgi:hypothetical protein